MDCNGKVEKMQEIAVLMAAGQGIRMRPITDTVPKPLVKVRGVPLIETVIGALQRRGVREIYVVTGYLQEQFSYLVQKYPEVRLIENKEYAVKNNISSIAAVGNILGSADCFICEADLYVANPDVLKRVFTTSGYLGKMVPGYSEDWVFDTENGRITGIHTGGADCYNMTGISYWKRWDAAVIYEEVRECLGQPGNENMFWDEAADRCLDRIDARVIEISEGELLEVDTVEELRELENRLG